MLRSSSISPFDSKDITEMMPIAKPNAQSLQKKFWKEHPKTSPMFTLVQSSAHLNDKPKGILAFDLDDTLYDTKNNTFINVNEIVELIKKAKSNGYMIVLVTARTLDVINNNETIPQSARAILNCFPSTDISWIYFTNGHSKHFSLNDLLKKYFANVPQMKRNICLVDDLVNNLIPCADLQYQTIQIDLAKVYLNLIHKFVHKISPKLESENDTLEHYFTHEYKELKKANTPIFKYTHNLIISKMKNGAYKNLNKPLVDGNSLLHLAAIHNDVPLAQVLLEQYKVTMTYINDLRRTPLLEACINQSWNVVFEIIKHLPAGTQYVAYGWMFLYALKFNDILLADKCLEAGISTDNIEIGTNEDAYNKAILNNNLIFAQLIQNHGPQHHNAIPALITAAKHDHISLQTFSWLIKQKQTQINAQWKGETALTTAILHPNIEKIKLLLSCENIDLIGIDIALEKIKNHADFNVIETLFKRPHIQLYLAKQKIIQQDIPAAIHILHESYKSHPEIINQLNSLAPLFPSEDDRNQFFNTVHHTLLSQYAERQDNLQNSCCFFKKSHLSKLNAANSLKQSLETNDVKFDDDQKQTLETNYPAVLSSKKLNGIYQSILRSK